MHGFNDDDLLEDTIRGLHNGDFSRLEPRLTATGAAEPDIIRWHREGRFQHELEGGCRGTDLRLFSRLEQRC